MQKQHPYSSEAVSAIIPGVTLKSSARVLLATSRGEFGEEFRDELLWKLIKGMGDIVSLLRRVLSVTSLYDGSDTGVMDMRISSISSVCLYSSASDQVLTLVIEPLDEELRECCKTTRLTIYSCGLEILDNDHS